MVLGVVKILCFKNKVFNKIDTEGIDWTVG